MKLYDHCNEDLHKQHPIMGLGKVLYQCHCTTNQGFSEEINTNLTKFLDNLIKVETLCKPLYNYYFCNQCLQMLCERCINQKLLFHYCPTCLFEIQGAISQPEKLKCWRNCLTCPICQSSLSLLETVQDEKSMLGTMEITPDSNVTQTESKREFHLKCFTCKYDTREQNIKLDKISFLANYITQLEREEFIGYKEISNLKLHYDLEFMIPHFLDFNPNLYAIEEVDGFDIKISDLLKLRGKEYKSILDKKKSNEGDIKESQKEDENKDEEEKLISSVNEILNLGNFNQHINHYPQRQILKSRRSKSCPHCDNLVSEPSSKASQEHKFFSKSPAYREVPDIKIENKRIELINGKPISLMLKFTNPLKFKTFIQLNSPLSNKWFIKGESNDVNDILENTIEPKLRFKKEFNHTLKIPTPKFSIEANTTNLEMIEKEEIDVEEDMILPNRILTCEEAVDIDFDENNLYQAIYERNKNSTSVYLPFTPNGEPNTEVIVPILLGYTTKKSNQNNEEEKGDKESVDDHYNTVHVWTYLRLGKIVE